MPIHLSLLQLIDSAFPTGSFSHSYGLETALQEGAVANGNELRGWLLSFIEGSLLPMEGAAVYLTYELVKNGINHMDLPHQYKLQRLDERLTLSKIARESREGGVKVAKRYLHMAEQLYPQAGLQIYRQWIQNKFCFGHSSIIHGILFVHLQQTVDNALLTYLYVAANNLIQNAMRAMAIGQTEGQKILQSLFPAIQEQVRLLMKTPPFQEDLAASSIFQEIEGMRHEQLYSRLFMS